MKDILGILKISEDTIINGVTFFDSDKEEKRSTHIRLVYMKE